MGGKGFPIGPETTRSNLLGRPSLMTNGLNVIQMGHFCLKILECLVVEFFVTALVLG